MEGQLWIGGGNSNNGANCGLLCELEQRLVECECEHLGSNYFNVYVTINDNHKDIGTASWENVRLSRASAAGA